MSAYRVILRVVFWVILRAGRVRIGSLHSVVPLARGDDTIAVGTAYTRGTVRLELAFLARDQGGTIYTPLREGRASWPEAAFEGDVAELAGVRVCVITLAALKAEKSQGRDDPVVAAKDSADVATLSRVT